MNNVEYFNLAKNVLLIEKYYLYGQNNYQYSTSHYRPHKKKQLEVTLPIPIQKINEDFHIKKLKQKKQKKYNKKKNEVNTSDINTQNTQNKENNKLEGTPDLKQVIPEIKNLNLNGDN
jgi:hypothetical protein